VVKTCCTSSGIHRTASRDPCNQAVVGGEALGASGHTRKRNTVIVSVYVDLNTGHIGEVWKPVDAVCEFHSNLVRYGRYVDHQLQGKRLYISRRSRMLRRSADSFEVGLSYRRRLDLTVCAWIPFVALAPIDNGVPGLLLENHVDAVTELSGNAHNATASVMVGRLMCRLLYLVLAVVLASFHSLLASREEVTTWIWLSLHPHQLVFLFAPIILPSTRNLCSDVSSDTTPISRSLRPAWYWKCPPLGSTSGK